MEQYETLYRNFPAAAEKKPRIISATTAGVPAEIRTRNLKARSQMSNRLLKLLPRSEFITFLTFWHRSFTFKF
jgi:hypothetical protein